MLVLLGIKHYVVFDSDQDQQQNRPLLRALGIADENKPRTDTPSTGVYNTYAMLKPRIEDVLKSSVGAAAFDAATKAVGDEFGRKAEETFKNPVTAKHVLERLRHDGLVCGTLHEIATRIVAL
jgi:hypothetical protein